MLSNYPTGAMNDPDAPFNQPTLEDVPCEHEHYDGDECGEDAEFDCECGRRVCGYAVVERRCTWRGETITIRECERCAELHIIPCSPGAQIEWLRRGLQAIDPAVLNGWDMEIFGQATDKIVADMATKSRENTEAVLRFMQAQAA